MMQIEEILTERAEIRQLTREQLMSILPHREPMLLIDEICDYEPGEWAIAYKNVSMYEPYLGGIFPVNH